MFTRKYWLTLPNQNYLTNLPHLGFLPLVLFYFILVVNGGVEPDHVQCITPVHFPIIETKPKEVCHQGFSSVGKQKVLGQLWLWSVLCPLTDLIHVLLSSPAMSLMIQVAGILRTMAKDFNVAVLVSSVTVKYYRHKNVLSGSVWHWNITNSPSCLDL